MTDETFEPRYFLGRWPGGRILYEDEQGCLGAIALPSWLRHPILRLKAEWHYRRHHQDWPRRPGGWG